MKKCDVKGCKEKATHFTKTLAFCDKHNEDIFGKKGAREIKVEYPERKTKRKIVLCGSMQDLSKFREIKAEILRKHPDYLIFPTEAYLNRITERDRTVDSPIPNMKRLALMLEAFSFIREADEIWVLNEKWRGYVWIGTTLDIGYALALNKRIKWLRRPRDPSLIAIFEGCPSKEVKESSNLVDVDGDAIHD